MRDAINFENMVIDEVTGTFCICSCNKGICSLGTYRNEGNSSAVAFEQDVSEFKCMRRLCYSIKELSGYKNLAEGEKMHF